MDDVSYLICAGLAGALSVMSCGFDWDPFDPRLDGTTTTSSGMGANGGRGGSGGGVTSTTTTGGGGSGGELQCAPGTANCDGDDENGCEADLTNVSSCGACGVVCGDGPCGTTLSGTFDTEPTDWTLNGDATHHASTSAIRLTPSSRNDAGTAFFVRPIVIDDFVATFEARIDLTTTNTSGGGGAGGSITVTDPPADGLAFAIQTTGPTAVGNRGGGLGLAGLEGHAWELDTFSGSDCGDPDHQHAGISSLAVCVGSDDDELTPIAASGPISGGLAESGWRDVTVTLSEGMASMSIDGDLAVGPVSLTGFTPGTPHYVGFGAGTGFYGNRHEVRNVTITFPTPRCL